MKKNWLQVLSLLLSVVLLGVLLKQNQTVKDLRNSLQTVENRLYSLQDDVRGISNDVLRAIEDAEKLISGYEVQPLYIDPEKQTLEANVVLTLKRWSEDTEIQVKTVVGRDTVITHLPMNGDGVCTGQMAFPVNQGSEVRLEASVIQGGVTTRQELGGWGDISMLLPIRMLSWGGSTPTYANGVFTVDQFEGHLENQNGQNIAGINTRYRLYVNDQLVREEAQCRNWEYNCNLGDEIRMTLYCEDEFGLGYEFALYAGVCEENGDLQEDATAGRGHEYPILTWPK